MDSIPNHPYQLRVDILPQYGLPNQKIPKECIKYYNHKFSDFQKWVDIPMTNWLIGYEISEKGKPHLQSIVWFEEILTQTKLSKYRNWWKQYSAKTYQPVSLTKSIKPKHLAIYCTKGSEVYTNLSEEIVFQIPQWSDDIKKVAEDKRIEKMQLFDKVCTDYVSNNPISSFASDFPCNGHIVLHEDPQIYYSYLKAFSLMYYEIYHNPLRRHSGINQLIKNKILTHDNYIKFLYKNFFEM